MHAAERAYNSHSRVVRGGRQFSNSERHNACHLDRPLRPLARQTLRLPKLWSSQHDEILRQCNSLWVESVDVMLRNNENRGRIGNAKRVENDFSPNKLQVFGRHKQDMQWQ